MSADSKNFEKGTDLPSARLPPHAARLTSPISMSDLPYNPLTDVSSVAPSPFFPPHLNLHSPLHESPSNSSPSGDVRDSSPPRMNSSAPTPRSSAGLSVPVTGQAPYPGANLFAKGDGLATVGMPFGSSYGVLNMPNSPMATPVMDSTRLKTEQLRMLQDQNAQLLVNFEEMESRSHFFSSRNEELEQQVRQMKLQLVELTNYQRNELSEKQRLMADLDERTAQAQMLAEQTREFMRRLESSDEKVKSVENKFAALNNELQHVKETAAAAQTALKSANEKVFLQSRDLEMRAQEFSAVKSELEALKSSSSDALRKSAMEIESLSEALRMRKEKQFSLLEKAAAADEDARKCKDEVSHLLELLQQAQNQINDLCARVTTDEKSRSQQNEVVKAALFEAEKARKRMDDLRFQNEALESDKLKLEAEVHAAGENVRDMGQKVFAVLERLKLSEVGKTKAIEALKARDNEVAQLKKKNDSLSKEALKYGKNTSALELEIARLNDHLEAMKQTSTALSSRCKEETRVKLQEQESRVAAEDKMNVLQTRVTGLLQRLQHEENEASIAKADSKALKERTIALEQELKTTRAALIGERDNVKFLTASLRDKTMEADKLYARVAQGSATPAQALLADGRADAAATAPGDASPPSSPSDFDGPTFPGAEVDPATREKMVESIEPDDDKVRENGGRGRFYLDSKPTQGFILIKAERKSAKQLLRRLAINEALSKAQKCKPSVCIEQHVKKLCNALGLALVDGEARVRLQAKCAQLEERQAALGRLTDALHAKIEAEEIARRQVIVGYCRAVVGAALTQSALTASVSAFSQAAGPSTSVYTPRPTSICLKLNECCLGDDEVQALVAVLRDEAVSSSLDAPSGDAERFTPSVRGISLVHELHLARNSLTDECIRSLCTLLTDASSCIRFVDLRANHLSDDALKKLQSALHTNSKVQEAVIRGGRIEATLSPLGMASLTAMNSAGSASTSAALAAAQAKSAVILLDCRDQRPPVPINPLLHLSEIAPSACFLPSAPAGESQRLTNDAGSGAKGRFTPFENAGTSFSVTVARELSRAPSRASRRPATSLSGTPRASKGLGKVSPMNDTASRQSSKYEELALPAVTSPRSSNYSTSQVGRIKPAGSTPRGGSVYGSSAIPTSPLNDDSSFFFPPMTPTSR